LYQAHTNSSKQASFSKLVIIQPKIKIISEEVIMTNFISKSLEFIQLLIYKKIAGFLLFKLITICRLRLFVARTQINPWNLHLYA